MNAMIRRNIAVRLRQSGATTSEINNTNRSNVQASDNPTATTTQSEPSATAATSTDPTQNHQQDAPSTSASTSTDHPQNHLQNPSQAPSIDEQHHQTGQNNDSSDASASQSTLQQCAPATVLITDHQSIQATQNQQPVFVDDVL